MRVDWISEVENKFDHPAIVLWRAIELKHIEEVLNKYNLTEPILDLGCAEGKIAGLLLKGKKLIGLDNSWELLGQNKERDVYQGLVLADACYMPFKNGFFSSVFSNCVIEHISNIDKLLSEIFRVLRSDGALLFTVPSHKFGEFLFFSTIFNSFGLRRFSLWYQSKRNNLLNHFHCYDHNRWRDILKQKGFNMVASRYYMTKKATFVWDFLAALVFFLSMLWPLKHLVPKVNRMLIKFLTPYYAMDSEIGAGLVILAKK